MHFNDLVTAAARLQPLPGTIRQGGGLPSHHWRTRVERDPADARTWRLFVGPGAVNDRMAAMTYKATDDPRGWIMPPDWPGLARMRRSLGAAAEITLVDRLLTERTDPPYLLLRAPEQSPSMARHDFTLVGPERRPPSFRSAADWQLDFYECVVFLTATTAHYLAVETEFHFPVPNGLTRYRIAAAPQLPALTFGAPLGKQRELARLYLLRAPGADPSADKLVVQQRCFWSLWTAASDPKLDFPAAAPLSTGLSFVDGFLFVLDEIFNEALQFLAAALGTNATNYFWTD